MKYITLLCIVGLLFGCAGTQVENTPLEVEEKEIILYLVNNSTETKLFKIEWNNHPYGCYAIPNTGLKSCEYSIAAGELRAGKTFEKRLYGNWMKFGNRFTVVYNPMDQSQDYVMTLEWFSIEENMPDEMFFYVLDNDEGI